MQKVFEWSTYIIRVWLNCYQKHNCTSRGRPARASRVTADLTAFPATEQISWCLLLWGAWHDEALTTTHSLSRSTRWDDHISLGNLSFTTTRTNGITIMKMKFSILSFSLWVKNNLIKIDVQIFSASKWVEHDKHANFYFLQSTKKRASFWNKRIRQWKYFHYFKMCPLFPNKYLTLGTINNARFAAEKNCIMTATRLSYMTVIYTCRTSSPCQLEELRNLCFYLSLH